ncbi:M48 family metalloprotease [Pelomonas sp. SE-A7]|uniref:M48 family metalloprotease n=1 Tax=Pelomonas sp. SE-A7 TaxID=3054953 RepID=UPI00259C7DB9|nr:M48 family metalloprotease [Pelomonas sp. SE-A7]MDM4767051.1 M48 family metalloprotease [Pelomonas sp. SE-A7]
MSRSLNRPSRLAVACLSALLLLGPQTSLKAQVNLPSLGDSVSDEFTIGNERRYGDQIMRSIKLDPDYLDDPLLYEYINDIWQPLVSASTRMGNLGEDIKDRFAWEPFLVRDRSVNAFALPGGFVGVHLGLIAMTASRDELASVLAHELSHVTQRHIARSVTNDSRNSLLATAAMLAGLLVAVKGGSPDVANAAMIGGQAAAQQASLNFSRDMEREADRIGFNVLTEAGYSATGMYAMFERLEQANHLNDSGAYPYLRTHPLTSERIGEARARLGAGSWERPRSQAEHVMMAARARVMMDPRAETWTQLQNLDAGARNIDGKSYEQLGARYASTLAAIKLRNFDRAEAALGAAFFELGRLGSDARALRLLTYLSAELAVARGRPEAAMAAFRQLGAERGRVILLEKARLGMVDPDLASARDAADSLQTFLAVNNRDATAWNQLAQLWERLGHPLRAVRAQGEARAVVGDLNGAIDRLRSGLRQSRGRDADQIEASVIDARLRTLLYERRQLLAEMYPRGAPPGAELP